MGLLAWLERKVFLGDVVKDFGVLDEKRYAIGRIATSLLLCRRKGQLTLVFRTAGRSPMSVMIHYAYIDATPTALARIAAVVDEARAVAEGGGAAT